MITLQKTTTVEAIVKLLIERINTGEYHPEEKLPSERLLQDELGVGRLALREALSRLNAMGIIETSHGRGTFVQNTVKSKTFRDMLVPYFALNDPKRLQDLLVARTMVESEIAGIAALERTDGQLRELYRLVQYEFPKDATQMDAARQDLLFHRMLANIIDNSFLSTMHEALIDHIQLFLNEYVKSKKGPAEVMLPHLAILKALEEKDAEAARNEARSHISYSYRDYEEYIKKSAKR